MRKLIRKINFVTGWDQIFVTTTQNQINPFFYSIHHIMAEKMV